MSLGAGTVIVQQKRSTGVVNPVDGVGSADHIAVWLDANTITFLPSNTLITSGNNTILNLHNPAGGELSIAALSTSENFLSNPNSQPLNIYHFISKSIGFEAGGILAMYGSTSGKISIKGKAAAGTWTLTLPDNDGNANDFLITDGSGITSWTPLTAFVSAGRYTPTITNQTNIDSTTAFSCMFQAIKDLSTGSTIVNVAGKVTIDPTAAAGTATEIRISLPAGFPTTFAAEDDAAGVANPFESGSNTQRGNVLALSGGTVVRLRFDCLETSARIWAFNFLYTQVTPP